MHNQRRILLILALLTLLAQGLARMVIAPLWAHYDEASHYEYMRYVTENQRLPDRENADFAILRRIALTYDAQPPIQANCDTHGAAGCIRIGAQFDEMPAYYLLQALIQSVFATADLRQQVILARFVSVLLSVAVGLIGYATARELFPHTPLIAVGVPLTMGVLFGYVDLMSSVNNDVGAVAAVSLMVYASTRLVKHGLSPARLTVMLLAAGLCIAVKSSAFIALPIGGFALFLMLWRRLPMWGKTLIVVIPAVCMVFAFVWIPNYGLYLRPALNDLMPVGGLNARLGSWYLAEHRIHYWAALRWLFVTFWSGFATGVAGIPQGGIVVFAILSGAAVIGMMRGWAVETLTLWQRQVILLLLCATACSLILSILRIDPPGGYIPGARHVYTVIVPILICLLAGLGSWLPRRWQPYGLAALILSLYLIGLWSLITVQLAWYALNTP